MTVPVSSLLSRVVDQYHRTFCERKDAQEYLAKRGLTDTDVLKAFRVGYADGSLLKTIPRGGEIRDELKVVGVVTAEGRELLGGCVVIPIPDPLSGEWTTLYGRGMRTPRHCYLAGPLRGVLNYQAARSASEVILTESIIDALSFHQVGVSTAIPIYGTNGFTADHLDLLKREGVRRVILALDGDDAGRRATAALKEKLASLGIAVRVMPYPVRVQWEFRRHLEAVYQDGDGEREGDFRARLFGPDWSGRARPDVHCRLTHDDARSSELRRPEEDRVASLPVER